MQLFLHISVCMGPTCVAEHVGTAGPQSLERCLHPRESKPEVLCLSMGWAVSSTACTGLLGVYMLQGDHSGLSGVCGKESPGLSACYSQAELIDIFPL